MRVAASPRVVDRDPVVRARRPRLRGGRDRPHRRADLQGRALRRGDHRPRGHPPPGGHRPAHRPGQPPQAERRPRRRAARPVHLAPVAAAALRPRRLQGLQRHLRPSRRRRAAGAPRAQARRGRGRSRLGLPPRRRRVLRARRSWTARTRTRLILRASRGPDRERRRAQHRGVAGRGAPAPRGRQRRSRAPGRRRAHVRQQAQPLDGAQPGRRGAAAHDARQAARARRALLQRRRAGRRGSPADWAWAARRWTRSPAPPSCTTSARSASPTRSSTSPAASPTASGSSSTSTPSSASASSTARRRCARWRGWSGPATSAGTGPATRIACAARRSRSGARIVAVCDAYEAMTADRSYRAAVSHELGLPGAAPLGRHPVRPRGRRGLPHRDRDRRRGARARRRPARGRARADAARFGRRRGRWTRTPTSPSRRPEPHPPAQAPPRQRGRRHLHRLGLGDDVHRVEHIAQVDEQRAEHRPEAAVERLRWPGDRTAR